MSAEFIVAACDQSTLRPGLEWMYRDLPPDQRSLQVEIAAEGLRCDDVMIATRAGRTVGAITTQAAAGRVGWLWAPQVDQSSGSAELLRAIADRLIAAGVTRLTEARVCIAQALLPLGAECAALLEDHGFVCLTEMIRLVRQCESGTVAEPTSDLRLVEFCEQRRPDFEDVVRRTYALSQDCPELDGVRLVSDVLDGYRACGDFRPDLWQLASEGDEFVGCVLLAEFPDERRCELQYMGVVPEARGRRLGAALCARAVSLAKGCGAQELWLSVDARNFPAIRHYRAADFAEVDRRRVFVLRLPDAPAHG